MFCGVKCRLSFVGVVLPIFATLASAMPLDAAETDVSAVDSRTYQQVVAPFLRSHCQKCHGPDTSEAEFRVDTQLNTDFSDHAVLEKWKEVRSVLDTGSMPPEEERQPSSTAVRRITTWIEQEVIRSEKARNSSEIIMRRLNRDEYNNTIRDLIGIDLQPAKIFPEDPPASGFDNIGNALTISPLHMELYVQAAKSVLDRAITSLPEQPESIKWHFEIEDGNKGMDRHRQQIGKQRIIVNAGNNQIADGLTKLRFAGWDRGCGFRDFIVPHAGTYVVRVRAGGMVPDESKTREKGIAIHQYRQQQRVAKMSAKEREREMQRFEKYVAKGITNHFNLDRRYRYGLPRLKLTSNLNGQGRTLGEIDIDASVEAPKEYEFSAWFSKHKAGVQAKNVYKIPRDNQNFWLKEADEFPRPEIFIDWMEIEGPVYKQWPPVSHSRIFVDSENANPTDADSEFRYARDVLSNFMTTAYRRPVSDAEIDSKLQLFRRVRPNKPDFFEAMKTPLIAVLCSPHFLYMVEPQSKAAPSLMAEFRDLKSLEGNVIRARVIAKKANQVSVQREDGKVFSLPIERFSPEDISYIRGLTDKQLKYQTLESSNGRTMTASIVSVTSDRVKVRRSDGAQFDLSINSLSPASQALVRGWSVAIEKSDRVPVTSYELASRLSYFLWSSMPDAALSELAASDRLRDTAVIKQQIDRMLADSRSDAFVKNFAGQWLGLRKLGINPPAANIYPRYDEHLEVSMRKETEAFFKHILQNDLSAMNFVRSDFLTLNGRMARHYDIRGVQGDQFRRVNVPSGSPRGGLITQASILSVTSNGTRTSPVLRGVWILENLLGDPPPPPPPNAGDIPPLAKGIKDPTVRQRLAAHRSRTQCSRCHQKIDPLGFALENYDATGEWRDQEPLQPERGVRSSDPPIDASARLPDGRTFDGATGLQEVLAENRTEFSECLARKMLIYALGRELGFSDAEVVRQASMSMQENGMTLRSLIYFIATSELFLSK